MDAAEWFLARGVKRRPAGSDTVMLVVPVTRQKEPHDCGRAGALAICEAFGVKRVAHDFFPADPMNGCDPGELESCYRRLGFDVASGNFDVPLLRAMTRAGRLVHVPMQSDKVGHWVVVLGVTPSGYVHLMDPDPEGPAKLHADEFVPLWQDATRLGASYVRWGIAVGKV